MLGQFLTLIASEDRLVSSNGQRKQQRSDVQLSDSLASLCIMGGFLKPLVHHSTIVLSGLRGRLVGHPLCREMQVSRTAEVIFPSLALKKLAFLTYTSSYLAAPTVISSSIFFFFFFSTPNSLLFLPRPVGAPVGASAAPPARRTAV